MEIQAVVFGLFDTLVDYYSPTVRNDNLKLVASVLSAPYQGLLNMWDESFNKLMKGEIKNYQAFLYYICSRLELSINDDQIELAAGIRQYMTIKEVTTPRTGALEMLSYLKSKGFCLGLISNCSLEVTKIWEETVLAPLVDIAIFSCKEGTMKPDPLIYQTAAKKLNVSPDHCLYIADGSNHELTGAVTAGMRALMLRTGGEKYSDLNREWTGKVITSFQELPALLDNNI